MKQVLTLVVKLQPTPEQASKLAATLQVFADACNYVNDNTHPKLTNKIALQSLTDQTIKETFSLVANIALRACARVAVRLLCKHRDGNVYLHIQLKTEAPESDQSSQSSNVIGVDFGHRDIAVTSEVEKWDGQDIQQVRDRLSKVRASLQAKRSKGTRSTRRRARQSLQRLSGKNRRYQQWLNHQISKAIVQRANALNAVIAVEDLTGIRECTNKLPRNKTERRSSSGWAFFQLRLFIAYKALQAGVQVLAVNPVYTSQICHQCLHIHPVQGKSYRSGKGFTCGHCGWQGEADLNGANLIKRLGLSLNQLGGAEKLSCSLSEHILRATETSRLEHVSA